jgi:phosphatidylglycerol---prolipoprotein diacylglyceryl transferase
MSMFDWLAVATQEAIRWEELGLSPSLFSIGWFELRWYSLAYLAGIVLGYWHLTRMVKAPGSPMAARHADDLFFYCTLGIILGGRLGYAAFYRPELFTSTELFMLWEGGMSFHGGVLGTVIAIAWVAWRGQLSFLRVCDYIAVNVGFGMLFGRIANFINGELWGRAVASDVPWAMIFPTDPLRLPRHPSQLYEALLEGALVIAVMLPVFWKTRARYRPGLLVGLFTALVCGARFIVEFYREPDAHLQQRVVETGLSQGQWLSIPLILVGVGLVAWALWRPELGSARKPAEA